MKILSDTFRYIQLHANTEGDHNLALRQSIKERMDGYF